MITTLMTHTDETRAKKIGVCSSKGHTGVSYIKGLRVFSRESRLDEDELRGDVLPGGCGSSG